MNGVFECAIGVIQEGRIGEAPFFFIVLGARESVRMQLATGAMKFRLQRWHIEIQPRLQSKDGEEVTARRRLNLAAVGAEQSGIVVGYRTRPTGNGNRGIDYLQHCLNLAYKKIATTRRMNRNRRTAWNSD